MPATTGTTITNQTANAANRSAPDHAVLTMNMRQASGSGDFPEHRMTGQGSSARLPLARELLISPLRSAAYPLLKGRPCAHLPAETGAGTDLQFRL